MSYSTTVLGHIVPLRIHYNSDDQQHREGGPAVMSEYDRVLEDNNPLFSNSDPLYYSIAEWWNQGVCTRDENDGPAITEQFGDSLQEIYMKDGMLHRENGPAYTNTVSGVTEQEIYASNGELQSVKTNKFTGLFLRATGIFPLISVPCRDRESFFGCEYTCEHYEEEIKRKIPYPLLDKSGKKFYQDKSLHRLCGPAYIYTRPVNNLIKKLAENPNFLKVILALGHEYNLIEETIKRYFICGEEYTEKDYNTKIKMLKKYARLWFDKTYEPGTQGFIERAEKSMTELGITE